MVNKLFRHPGTSSPALSKNFMLCSARTKPVDASTSFLTRVKPSSLSRTARCCASRPLSSSPTVGSTPIKSHLLERHASAQSGGLRPSTTGRPALRPSSSRTGVALLTSYRSFHSTLDKMAKDVPPEEQLAVPESPSLESITFPTNRLKSVMEDPDKDPLCLIACGSFSPITYLHLRMFEMARDYAKFNTNFEIVGGYLSPVGDAYKKKGLANAKHRIAMCDLATTQTSKWLMVDPWEALQAEYQPTAEVLDHFNHELNEIHGGVLTKEGGARKPIRIALLAGADLIETMSTPGVWLQKDLERILGEHGTFIVERKGTDIDAALSGLYKWKDNIWVIRQLIQNDVSSTKIRDHLDKGMNVKYLIPGQAIEYIESHDLYKSQGEDDKGGEAMGAEASAITNGRPIGSEG